MSTRIGAVVAAAAAGSAVGVALAAAAAGAVSGSLAADEFGKKSIIAAANDVSASGGISSWGLREGSSSIDLDEGSKYECSHVSGMDTRGNSVDESASRSEHCEGREWSTQDAPAWV